MGLDPVSMTLAGGLGIGKAFMGHEQAKSQNEAIKASIRSQRNAAQLRNQQLTNQTALERSKRMDQAERILGKMRVAAGAAGREFDGSFQALGRQTATDAATDVAILDRNLSNNIRATNSQMQANAARLNANRSDPLFSAFQGAMQGASMGLSIGKMIPSKELAGEAGSYAAGSTQQINTFTGIGIT